MPATTSRISNSAERPDGGVPIWLAVLVVVLAVAVVVVGALVTRSLAQGAPGARVDAEGVEMRRLESEVGRSPQSVQARLELGAAYQRAGRPDDALKAYSAVLSIEPTNTAALYNSAVALLGKGQYAEAERRLRAVLKVDSSHTLAAKELAHQMADAKKPREVVRVLRPALAAHPEYSDLQLLAAQAYEALGKTKEARRHYRLALVYQPDNRPARAGLKRVNGQDR